MYYMMYNEYVSKHIFKYAIILYTNFQLDFVLKVSWLTTCE